jgi:hypothetical protein
MFCVAFNSLREPFQTLNDEHRDPSPENRVSARTRKRVAEMSDVERIALARELARRKGALLEAPVRRTVATPDVRPSAKKADDEQAEATARLTAALRNTQRHLDRLERSFTPSRYGGGTSAPASARYARLLRRADRLERQLRELR